MTPRPRSPGPLAPLARPHARARRVVAAMSRQPTDLADPRLGVLIANCEFGLRRLLRTDRAEVFFYAANGHGGGRR